MTEDQFKVMNGKEGLGIGDKVGNCELLIFNSELLMMNLQ